MENIISAAKTDVFRVRINRKSSRNWNLCMQRTVLP